MNRRPLATALAALTVLLLGACSTPLPVPEPDGTPAVATAAVTVEQIDAVLADVQATLSAADEAQDAELLEPRVTGPALAMRRVEYQLAAAGDAEAITPVPPAAQTLVAPATDEWPRTVMVVTEPPADLQAPLLLTLVQEGPRAQFQLWSWVRLFPGVQMPATAQPELGSPPVPVDTEALAMPPTEVLEGYVDLLTSGADSAYAERFGEDPLREGIVAVRTAWTEAVTDMGGLTETYAPGDAGVQTLGTADGGAIVVGTVQTVTTITLDDSTLTIGDETAALLGEETVAESLAVTWLSMVAFAVPPAGSDAPVEVLGAEHSRTEATGE